MSSKAKAPFPRRHRFGRAARYSLSDTLRYEAVSRGDEPPAPLPPEQERFLTPRQLAERLGLSLPTVWRRSADADEAQSTAA